MISTRYGLKFALSAFVTASLLCAAPSAHAGFLGKMKKKAEKISGKADEANAKIDEKAAEATRPIDEAQQAAADAQNKAMAPVVQAQQAAADAQNKAMAPVHNARNAASNARNKALSPVRNVQGKVAGARNTAMQPIHSAQHRVAHLKGQITGAANLTDGAFSRDAALRGLGLDALPSPDGRALRLTGKVRNAMERTHAQQLAARHFPGTIQNQIRIAPEMAKANAKANIRGGRSPFKNAGKTFRNPLR